LAAFLRVATRMDTYGIEPFDAKDQRGNGIAVGFNFKGLSVFKSSQQVNFFRWESMLNYECEKKTVVITIKTRDLKKKIGFKCDSRASAMQLYRRLREASRFYRWVSVTLTSVANLNLNYMARSTDYRSDSGKSHKIASPSINRSTDSEASDSSFSSGQTCQVKRIASFSRPQRFFTLSPPRVPEKMVQLRVPSAEAVTPTNQPKVPANCPPDIPAIILHPPNPDEGPKTPTLELINLTTKPTEVAMVGLPKEVDPVVSECVAKEEDVKSHSETSDFQNVNNNEANDGKYRDPTRMEEGEGDGRDVGKDEKIEEIADKGNGGKIENQYEKNAIKAEGKAEHGEEEEEEEETDLSPTGVSYTLNSISQESLLNVASPFGDAAKMSFFTNLDSNRLGLGVLDLKLSNSMTSITIPPTGCASTASHREYS
uniref:FERM domain-containing protein n=1 Tax=Taenia asiatica TaxID=60517 RepID=A0A158R8U8_TAEAS